MNYVYNTTYQNTVYNYIEIRKIDSFNFLISNSLDFAYNNIRGDFSMNDSNIIMKQFNVLKNSNTGEIISLKKNITFNIEIDENGFYYSNDRYNIYTFGKTQEEAENNLVQSFLDQYEEYALEEDDKLDNRALKLKKDLLLIFGEHNAQSN